jgi:sugar O-acyltransferase (sialic acid O-acetyltransferase NeuD family)
MARGLVILGAGGNAHDVLDIVEALNDTGGNDRWEPAGYLDDTRPAGSEYLGLPVLGGLRDAGKFQRNGFISAIRNEAVYPKASDILALTGLALDSYVTLVHPAAGVSKRARIGRGVYVNFGASVAGGVTLGDHSSVGPGCVIGHESVVDDYAIIAAGAVISGGVWIGRACYLGSGSLVKQKLRVGEGALVAMGAVVVRDVAANSVVVGNPARPLERKSAHLRRRTEFRET